VCFSYKHVAFHPAPVKSDDHKTTKKVTATEATATTGTFAPRQWSRSETLQRQQAAHLTNTWPEQLRKNKRSANHFGILVAHCESFRAGNLTGLPGGHPETDTVDLNCIRRQTRSDDSKCRCKLVHPGFKDGIMNQSNSLATLIFCNIHQLK